MQAEGRQFCVRVGQALHIERRVLRQLLKHGHCLAGLVGAPQDAGQSTLQLLKGAACVEHLFAELSQLVQAHHGACPGQGLVRRRAQLAAGTGAGVAQGVDGLGRAA